ncbi:hypothetical protein G6L08_03260 [Agrobacterium rhizogenes]|nr:hypothetical protein [Rhizobium rhizogenes]
MTHTTIINLWPSTAAFAFDVCVPYEAAKAMRRRGSIPSCYWVRVVSAAKRRGIDGVTFERLAKLIAIPLEAAE